MNARAVAKLVGAKIGTLNAWIARGYIRGLEVGTSGKRRNIDADTALRIAIFADLIRFARYMPPEHASSLAWEIDLSKGGGFLVAPGAENYTAANPGNTRLFGAIYTPADAPGGVAATIARLPKLPRTYVTINVDEIAEQVRQAEAEWLARQEGKQPDG
jgi:hypothetical protein